MKFVIDPPISTKIQRMRERTRWQHPALQDIDPTRLAIAPPVSDLPTPDPSASDPSAPDPEADFSFLVLGDSGTGRNSRSNNPQQRVADLLAPHLHSSRFVLHTGDVVYLVGSREQYRQNFLEPYRCLLASDRLPAYDRMTFSTPFFPVLGNHDYYDLPWIYGAIAQLTWPLRRLLRLPDLDVGWHGSNCGDAYARAFLDYRNALSPQQLAEHLDRHYTSPSPTGRCLTYRPGQFTRIPHRYYTFRSGGIDFFALDSCTFNDPLPVTEDGITENGITKDGFTKNGITERDLQTRRDRLQQERQQLLDTIAFADSDTLDGREDLEDAYTDLEDLEERLLDLEKQLDRDRPTAVDTDQLDWLRDRLIASWQDPSARGRILFFHHPPYVTEATKWDQAQTLAVRTRLRTVLDAVAREVNVGDRPTVDLVLNGHAHCLEYLRTENTGHADANIPWIVCGGSGFSLRRQRSEGAVLTESDEAIARSHCFLGRSGHGPHKRRPYSCLKIEVKAGTPPQFVVHPLVVEKYHHRWQTKAIDPWHVGSAALTT